MKTATLLLAGLAALAVGAVVFTEVKSGASPLATQIDPTVGTWTIANWDVLKTNPDVANSPLVQTVPAHAFVTSNNMQGLLGAIGNGAAANLGPVAAWIQAQNAAGHRVYQSDPISNAQLSGQTGYIYVLDLAPTGGGYIEVTA